MIKFIDTKTGNIFNGDTIFDDTKELNYLDYLDKKSYCFWFDEGQSTKMHYVKPIFILSDYRHLQVSMPLKDNDVFKLIDIKNLKSSDEEIINDHKYQNITPLFASTNTKTNEMILSLDGYPYQDYYISVLYLYSNSLSSGTYMTTFNINKNKYLVGADFYNEDESLKINLSNQGVELPTSIQKAIYDSNIFEETEDNILLNRKFKELLSENKNILMNKGSYNSLINSLNWFEYGDLVKIQEYWKNKNIPNGLFRYDLSPLITKELSQCLNIYSKTTYIGLYLALNKNKYDENGQIIYRGPDNDLVEQIKVPDPNDPDKFPDVYITKELKVLPEPNPILENISTKFSKEILSLKMTLLGVFYSGYFMPLHLDLLHSTIEHIIYTNTFKIQNFNKINREDWFNGINIFDCNLKPENKFILLNNKIGVSNKTVLGNHWKDGNNYGEVQLFGVDKLEDIKTISEEELKTFYTQLYSGISTFVPVECKLPVVSQYDVLQKIQLLYDDKLLQVDKISKPENGIITVKFNILFTKPKYKTTEDDKIIEVPYNIGINLILNNGKTYLRHFKIYISDKSYQNIELYSLQKLNQTELNEVFLQGKNLNWNLFAFDNNPSIIPDGVDLSKLPKTFYTQYITAKHSTADVGLTKQWQSKLFLNKEQLQKVYTFINNQLGEIEKPINYENLEYIREVLLKNLFILNDNNTYTSLNEYFYNTNSKLYGDLLIREKHLVHNTNFIRTYLYFLEKGYNIIDQEYDILKIDNYNLYKNKKHWNCSFNIHRSYNQTNNETNTIFKYNGNQNLDSIIIKYNDEKIEYEFTTEKYSQEFELINFNVNKNDKIQILLKSNDLIIDEIYNINVDPIDFNIHQIITPPNKLYAYGKFENEEAKFVNVFDLLNEKSQNIKYEESLKFIPQFHKLINLKDNYIVQQNDIICAIPNFYHTLTLGDIRWKFINDSTRKEYIPKFKSEKNAHTLEPFALPYNPVNLEPGYYSIELNYSMDKTQLVKKLNSCLLVKKSENLLYDLRDKHSDEHKGN